MLLNRIIIPPKAAFFGLYLGIIIASFVVASLNPCQKQSCQVSDPLDKDLIRNANAPGHPGDPASFPNEI